MHTAPVPMMNNLKWRMHAVITVDLQIYDIACVVAKYFRRALQMVARNLPHIKAFLEERGIIHWRGWLTKAIRTNLPNYCRCPLN